jgi:hypothetical protein
MIKLICDPFMMGLVLAVQAMNSMPMEQILDDAAQTAINEHPHNTNISEMVEFAGNFIRMQLGMS